MLLRVACSLVALTAGNAALLLGMMLEAARARGLLLEDHMGEPDRALPQAWEIFVVFAVASVAGWAVVGLPLTLAVPARVPVRLGWLPALLIGAALGPLALLLLFAATFAFQGQLTRFSLAHTETFWPLAGLVSSVSFLVYRALLARVSHRAPG